MAWRGPAPDRAATLKDARYTIMRESHSLYIISEGGLRTSFFETAKGKLYLGGCLEILPEVSDGGVDMALCSLPYGVTDFRWDKRIDMERLWKEYCRVTKHNAAIVLTAQQPFVTDVINAGRKFFRYKSS